MGVEDIKYFAIRKKGFGSGKFFAKRGGGEGGGMMQRYYRQILILLIYRQIFILTKLRIYTIIFEKDRVYFSHLLRAVRVRIGLFEK